MKLFLLIALIFFFHRAKAQKPLAVRSTLGSSGISSATLLGKQNIYFQQSVGQSGVTGHFVHSGKILKPGFIQPVLKAKKLKAENSPLIYPNPVRETLFLYFQKKTNEDIQIRIFSLMGKLLLEKHFPPNSSFQINLSELPTGQYIFQSHSNTTHFVRQIIKEQT